MDAVLHGAGVGYNTEIVRSTDRYVQVYCLSVAQGLWLKESGGTRPRVTGDG